MDVSVVIPTFNYGHLVERAIRSVLAQTLSPREVIVVDDGSVDETAQVLARLPVRVVTTPRLGVSAARNRGVDACGGEWVAFLDADDEWHPSKLTAQATCVAEFPDVGAIGCANVVRDAAGNVLRTRFFPHPADDRLLRLRGLALREPWVGSSNSGVLLRRATFASLGGFDESLEAAEDWDLWLRLGDRFRIRNVHQVLVTIWFHRTGMFRNADLMERAQRAVLAKAKSRFPDVFDASLVAEVEAMIERDAIGERNRPRWRRAVDRLAERTNWRTK